MKEIPEGLYCYSILSIDENTFKIHTNNCPHFYFMGDNTGSCDLINEIIIDQIKECGYNYE